MHQLENIPIVHKSWNWSYQFQEGITNHQRQTECIPKHCLLFSSNSNSERALMQEPLTDKKYENTTQSTTLLTSRKQKMELQYYSDLTKKYDRNMSQMPWPVHTTRGKWKLVYIVGLTFKSPSFWPPMANAARDGWNLVCVAGLISSSSLWLRTDVVSKLVDSVPHISSHSPFEQIENI